jgi:hypothetical protein
MSTPIALLRARLSHTGRRLRKLNRIERALAALQARRRELLGHELARARPSIMYDSVTLDQVPGDAPAVAGYVGGRWPTYGQLARRVPHARRLSIAVNAGEDADCLDVEPGDAVIAQAAGWVRRQVGRGVKRPVLYTSVSQLQALVDALERAAIPRGHVRLWSAHYTMRPHLCGPDCGFGLQEHADATQYTDRALGRNLDESLCTAGFWASS